MAGYERSLYQMYLSHVPMFSACSSEQLDQIAQLGEAVTYKDGDVIVREGDTGDRFFVLSGGKAAVSRQGRQLTTLGEGDYFGELALFDPAPRNATVTAESPTMLITLDRDAFARALDDIPAVRDSLLRGMARRLHDLDARV